MPQNLRAVGDRIEQLLDELHAVADPQGLAIAEELLRSVTELYGGGLERIVTLGARQARTELIRRFNQPSVKPCSLLPPACARSRSRLVVTSTARTTLYRTRCCVPWPILIRSNRGRI